MATIIQLRRDTAANWTSVNPILANGELGIESDTDKAKAGNGVDVWTALSYFGGDESVWGGIAGTLSDQTDLQDALNLKANQSDLVVTNTSVNDNFLAIGVNSTDIGNNSTDIGSNTTAIGIVSGNLTNHENDLANPHAVTQTQVGLDQVDNTSDLNKPISTATQTALDGKLDDTAVIDDLNDVDTTGVLDTNDVLTWNGVNWVQDNWVSNHIDDTLNPHNVTKSQVGLGNVDNTSDLSKPISTATQTALNNKEDYLGTAGTPGYILSDNSGTRSWIAQTSNTDINAIWGNITGTLSSQTDLQDALNLKFNNTGGTVTGDIDIVSGSGAKLNIETTISGGQPQLHLTDFNSVPRGIFGADTTTGDVGLTRVDASGDVVGTIRLDTLGNVKLLAGPSETIPVMTEDSHLVNKLYVDGLSDNYELDLGLPAGNNYILGSDIAGNRSWFDAASIGVTSINGEIGVVVLDTDDINEGITNLYYTNSRADARVQAAIQDTVSSSTTLYSSSKVDSLISGSLSYKGGWDATNNIPSISDGTGSNGDFYKVEVAGTQDLGSGNIVFELGDDVIHNGSIYQSFGSSSAVDSVNGYTGVVVLGTDDINEGSANLWYTDVRVDARLVNIIDDNATVSNLTWSSTKIDTEIGVQIGNISFPVTSVNSQTGVVVINKSDVGLSDVDNTSDADKPVSTATQIALNGKSDTNHLHTGVYEPANANIQTHVTLTDGSNPHNTDFIGLSDTPIDYTGYTGTRVTVNATEDGVEFVQPSSIIAESKPTGLIDGGELNIVTLVNVEVINGTGIIIDSYTNPNSKPINELISWNTGNTPIINGTPIAGDVVYLTIEKGISPGPVANTTEGLLKQYNNIQPTPSQYRDEIYLGYILYNGSTWGEVSAPIVVNNSATSLAEYVKTVAGPSFVQNGGKVTESNTFSMSREAGVVWELNRNWHVNKKDPHRESFNEDIDFQFRYVNRDFSTVSALTSVIDPTDYDNNGTVQAIGGNNSTTSIQRVFIDQRDNYWVLYGQNLDDNFSEAVARIGIDQANTVIPSLLQNSIFLGYIISQRNQNHWTTERARFVSVSEAVGGGSSQGAQTFTDLTDTPSSYVGQANQLVSVASDELSLEFITPTANDAAVWGNITGTLNNQTDLWDELEGKQDIIAGIDNKLNSVLSYDSGSRTLTLSPTGVDFEVYAYNNRFIFNTPQSVIIPTGIAKVTCGFDASGTFIAIDESIFEQDEAALLGTCIISRITQNSIANIILLIMDIRYPYDMGPSTREVFLHTDGLEYRAGFAMENIVPNGTGNTAGDLQFSVEPGQVFLANSTYGSQQYPQLLTLPAQIPIMYVYNTELKLKPADDYPILYNGSAGGDYTGLRLAYNERFDDGSGNITGDLIEVGNNKFVCYHYFALMGLYTSIIGVVGLAEYNTLEEARQGVFVEVSTLLETDPVYKFYTPIGSITLEANDNYSNVGKARIVSDTDETYVDLRISKTAFNSSGQKSSFKQDVFDIHNEVNNKLTFNVDNINDGVGGNQVVKLSIYDDVDMSLVPQYKLITTASTDLNSFDEVSLDINGFAQKYPATGGAGSSEFTTRNVIEFKMAFFGGNTGMVSYTDGTANTVFARPGVAQANGSVIWGNELSITGLGTVIEISSTYIDGSRSAYTYVASDGALRTQIYTTDGVNITAGNLTSLPSASGIISAGISYNSESHLVFAYTNGSSIYNDYATLSSNNMSFPVSRNSGWSTNGSPVKVEVGSDGDNVCVSYYNTSNDAYWMEAKWDKPIFGTGNYNDYSSSRLFASSVTNLGGFDIQNGTFFSQVEIAPKSWQTYYAGYSSGSSISAPNLFGAPLSGSAAKTVNSSSGLGYNIVYNDAIEKLEVYEGNSQDPSGGYSKIYTDSIAYPSTLDPTYLDVVLFGATYATIIKGDTSLRNDIVFIDSNATRTDNYIGNASATVLAGEQIDILLGLPIINHPITYSPGDVFFLGPYKYQAISKHQVLMIIEETIFP